MKKPFKQTKAYEIARKFLPGLAKSLADVVPGGKLITGIIEQITGSGAEISADEMKVLQDFEKEMYALEVQDRKGAREMNVALNQSEHASWLAKNTASLIALAYTLFNFVIYVLILTGNMKASENMEILIVNSITNIAMLIIGFYFGSSNERSKATQMKIDRAQQQRAAA
jgi:hypothetical protein